MSAKPTTIYPIRGHFLLGIPAAVQVVETRERADELTATGAFTDNPKHPDRDTDAADLSQPASEPDQPAADAAPEV